MIMMRYFYLFLVVLHTLKDTWSDINIIAQIPYDLYFHNNLFSIFLLLIYLYLILNVYLLLMAHSLILLLSFKCLVCLYLIFLCNWN